MAEPLTDEAHEQWLADSAEQCRCCSGCWPVPCGGCQQGAMCDQTECVCGEDPFFDGWEDDDG